MSQVSIFPPFYGGNINGQGGLLDIYIVPQEEIPSYHPAAGKEEPLIYITYAKQGKNGEYTTALSRGTLSDVGSNPFFYKSTARPEIFSYS